jgi:hypothetical protein
MTPEFDKFVQEILTEAKRCQGPSLRQLSDKSGYRFMACRENPYSPGFKRIYWGHKDGSFDYTKCLRNPRPGTGAYEECKDIRRAQIRRQKRLRRRNKK